MDLPGGEKGEFHQPGRTPGRGAGSYKRLRIGSKPDALFVRRSAEHHRYCFADSNIRIPLRHKRRRSFDYSILILKCKMKISSAREIVEDEAPFWCVVRLTMVTGGDACRRVSRLRQCGRCATKTIPSTLASSPARSVARDALISRIPDSEMTWRM